MVDFCENGKGKITRASFGNLTREENGKGFVLLPLQGYSQAFAIMPKIEHTIDIQATKDRVWEIISDLENEPEYWYGTKEVRTISKEGNIVDREITQNFRNHKIKQRAILRPKDSVEIQYLKGLTEGVKVVSIESIDENTQRVRAFWDIHFPGIYWLATPFIKRHVERGTLNALERIKAAAEGKPLDEEAGKEKESQGGMSLART